MKRKKILRICAIAVLAAALAGGLYLRSIRDYKARVEALAFTDIDLRQVADGTYEGRCDTGVVSARVRVTVKDHILTDIELTEHQNGRGTPAEAILEEMLREQATDVDAVSGATCSSKVIRKAVEEALAKGLAEGAD